MFGLVPDVFGAYANGATALIALAALIVAGVAAHATWKTNNAQQKTLDLQRKQFAAAEQRIEREQASKITFTMELADEQTIGTWSWVAHVTNASDNPINSVVMLVTDDEKDFRDNDTEIRVVATPTTLPPTGTSPLEVAFTRGLDLRDVAVYSYFRDSSGVPWIRSLTGDLRKPGMGELARIVDARASYSLDKADRLSRTRRSDRSATSPDSSTPSDPPADRPSGGEQPPAP